MSREKFQNSGFSLIELLIVVGILSGISLFIINLNKQASSTQKKFQVDIDADFITKEIAGILADPANCNATQIIGKNADSTAAGQIDNIYGKYSTASTTGYGSSQINISSYEIKNSGLAEITDTNTETSLVINFSMPKIVSTKQATLKSRRIKLIITKSGSKIATCMSAWVNQKDYWTKSGNDIFYHSGNVGIGTVPSTAKLDVAGEVKFGNTSSTCNATNEGQQRYNSITKQMEFCNGTSWGAFGITSSIQLPPGPWVNGASTKTCPAGHHLTMCVAEVNSADGLSMMFQQHLTFSGTAGKITSCSANMTDIHDTYRLLVICVK